MQKAEVVMRLGVIGVGHMGKYHVNVLSQIQDIQLIAVSDVNEDLVRPIAEEYHIDYFHTYEQMLPHVDAVTVATPSLTHYDICRELLKAGKHVLVEKPITKRYEEAEELFKLADEKHLTLQVGHVERFNSAVIELKRILNNPLLIETRRLQPMVPRNIETGVVIDLMIHDIDLVLMLVDSKVNQIAAIGKRISNEKEDIAHAQMMFENGCMASLTVSRVTEEKVRKMEISQSDSYLTIDFATQDLMIHRRSSINYIVDPKKVGYRQESIVERVSIHRDNPLRLQFINFVKTIRAENGTNENRELDLSTIETTLSIMKQVQTCW